MTGQVGPRGVAILVLAGIAGILLAILGWSNRGTGLVAPSVGLGASAPARTGQPLPTTRFYLGGAKVYVLETRLGDDSGYEDYNLGHHGLVVTTAQGQVVS
jgi:hypothetical protein